MRDTNKKQFEWFEIINVVVALVLTSIAVSRLKMVVQLKWL